MPPRQRADRKSKDDPMHGMAESGQHREHGSVLTSETVASVMPACATKRASNPATTQYPQSNAGVVLLTRRRPDETCWEVPTMENGITESGWLSSPPIEIARKHLAVAIDGCLTADVAPTTIHELFLVCPVPSRHPPAAGGGRAVYPLRRLLVRLYRGRMVQLGGRTLPPLRPLPLVVWTRKSTPRRAYAPHRCKSVGLCLKYSNQFHDWRRPDLFLEVRIPFVHTLKHAKTVSEYVRNREHSQCGTPTAPTSS